MSDVAIRVQSLGKMFLIGGSRERYKTFRDTLAGLFKKTARCKKAKNEPFWALKDVSFEIKRGEVVGVIGRNGAGKSTLLKILSRITEPTEGYAEIHGRVGSLLEVGTGFHPELTGRENVFLNGAILGMRRAEIEAKFDEIVAFAEVEKFIDTPVKHYSSGMYLRLAFAVAANLETEILLVDEVLAVGDTAFQKKCLGKMEDVSKQGRTVLFVSHSMGAISRLCKKAILLDSGRLDFAGVSADVISHYLYAGACAEGVRTWKPDEKRSSDEPVLPLALRILISEGKAGGRVDITKPFQVELEYRVTRPVPRFRVALRFLTADGTVAFTTSDSADPSFERKPAAPGTYVSRCQVPGNLLNEGQYLLTVSADVPFQQALFVEEAAVVFFVEQTGGVNSRFPEKWPGTVCPMLEWETEPVAPAASTETNPASS